jgi:plastocyanin
MKNLFVKTLRHVIAVMTLFSTLLIIPSCSDNDDAKPSTTTNTGVTTQDTTHTTTNGTTSGTTSGTTAGTTSGTTSSTAATKSVMIMDNTFSPASMTISVGTTVVWTNNGSMAHTVTSDSGLFDSGNMPAHATYSHTFSSAGTFPYHCTYHQSLGMVGTITVQ